MILLLDGTNSIDSRFKSCSRSNERCQEGRQKSNDKVRSLKQASATPTTIMMNGNAKLQNVSTTKILRSSAGGRGPRTIAVQNRTEIEIDHVMFTKLANHDQIVTCCIIIQSSRLLNLNANLDFLHLSTRRCFLASCTGLIHDCQVRLISVG